MLEPWRKYFNKSGTDIWMVMEKAIAVAQADNPKELRRRRDGLIERMYTPYFTEGPSSEDVTAHGSITVQRRHVETEDEAEEDEEDEEDDDDDDEEAAAAEEDRRVIAVSSDDEDDEQAYEEADEMVDGEVKESDTGLDDVFEDGVEALSNEMEEEKILIKEINSIKGSLEDLTQSEADVLDLMYRLQGLNMSLEVLKATDIGIQVNRHRKHRSKRVQELAKTLVRNWKGLVDEIMKNTQEINAEIKAAGSVQGSNLVGDDDVGLASPPLEEIGVGLLAARTGNMEISELLDFDEGDLSAFSRPSPPMSDGGPELSRATDRQRKQYSSSPSQERDAQRAKSTLSQDRDVRLPKGSPSERGFREPRGSSQEWDARGPRGSLPDHDYRVPKASPSKVQDVAGPKAGARVVKVDKHRPTNVGNKREEEIPRTNIRKGVAVATVAKPSSGIVGSGRPASGSTPPKSSATARPPPAVGIRPNVEASKPGLAPRSGAPSGDVMDAELDYHKRKIRASYQSIDQAKKQRTTVALDLTELPKGGPKAQRPAVKNGRTMMGRR